MQVKDKLAERRDEKRKLKIREENTGNRSAKKGKMGTGD